MAAEHRNPALKKTEAFLGATLLAASAATGVIGVHLARSQDATSGAQAALQAAPAATAVMATDEDGDEFDEGVVTADDEGDDDENENVPRRTVATPTTTFQPVPAVTQTAQPAVTQTRAS